MRQGETLGFSSFPTRTHVLRDTRRSPRHGEWYERASETTEASDHGHATRISTGGECRRGAEEKRISNAGKI